MTKKVLYLLIVGAVVLSIVATSLSARTSYDNRDRVKSKQSSTITQYSFPVNGRELMRDEPMDHNAVGDQSASGQSIRSSLGITRSASPPTGLTINSTYNDVNNAYEGRSVEHRGTPDFHFSYSDMKTATAASEGYGYMDYDPVAGSWPNGLGGGNGCRVQTDDGTERGTNPYLAVSPKGLIILGGRDNSGQPRDNRFYYQTVDQSCFFGAGSRINPSQYKIGYPAAIDTSKFIEPIVDVQVVGSDTVIHVTGSMADFYDVNTGDGVPLVETVIQYFRKVNGWGNGDLKRISHLITGLFESGHSLSGVFTYRIH